MWKKKLFSIKDEKENLMHICVWEYVYTHIWIQFNSKEKWSLKNLQENGWASMYDINWDHAISEKSAYSYV